MRNLLIAVLCLLGLNAALLAGRLFQEADAQIGGGGGVGPCDSNRSLSSIDSNGDGGVDVSDAVHLLRFLFSNGPEPQVCLAQGGGIEEQVADLLARVAALEGKTTLSDLDPNCADGEIPQWDDGVGQWDCVEAGTGGGLSPEDQQILDAMTLEDLPDGQGGTVSTIRVSGVNVQIVNGTGSTQTADGSGNLVVGYNGLRGLGMDNRSGSHNFVVGDENNYTRFGGVVAGRGNSISGDFSSVAGGEFNVASGRAATVAGGRSNTALGNNSAVSGGSLNLAGFDAHDGTVSGGTNHSLNEVGGHLPEGGGSPSEAPIEGFTFMEINAQGYPEYEHDTAEIRFVRLPGGSFEMGSPASESGRGIDEGPVRTVSLRPFLIAKYEISMADWDRVLGLGLIDTMLPQTNISYDDLQTPGGFLDLTGLSLPSEAQWEYACRSGTSGRYAGTGALDSMGWFSDNSGSQTHNVGLKAPNQFGLHDMHGNVWEWCEDIYKNDYYADEVPGFDPISTTGTGLRVFRGGGFEDCAEFCRSAHRVGGFSTDRGDFIGFRPIKQLP